MWAVLAVSGRLWRLSIDVCEVTSLVPSFWERKNWYMWLVRWCGGRLLDAMVLVVVA